jgi:hypothetical protein
MMKIIRDFQPKYHVNKPFFSQWTVNIFPTHTSHNTVQNISLYNSQNNGAIFHFAPLHRTINILNDIDAACGVIALALCLNISLPD